MNQTIKIGLLGLGNVGAGVAQILDENRQIIRRRTGKDIQIKTVVVRDLSKERPVELKGVQVTTDAMSVINDPEIQVIVEVMGGEYPAFDYICAALRLGKYVVTANKEVVSKHKKTFFDLARTHTSDLYYEASVGGGIPLIRTLKVGLAANKIEALYGIVNGTTNYILTKVSEEGKEFADVIADAQRLGFAEADPSMDVSGLDSAYKLSILASVAFKADVSVGNIEYEGIDGISLTDMRYAQELGYTIKLLAIGRALQDNQLSFKVHPTLIPSHHPLAGVRNEFNAVFIVGNAVGESLLAGRGAGSSPTGSAIVSDLMDIAFYDAPSASVRNLDYAFDKVTLVPNDQTASQFYIRLSAADTSGALAAIATVFGAHDISISKVLQKEIMDGAAEIVMMTHPVKESKMTQALHELQREKVVREILAKLRVALDE
jgi:homoserine dehydrogenase